MNRRRNPDRVLRIGTVLIAILALLGELTGHSNWVLVAIAAVLVLTLVTALALRSAST